ncbi:MAG: hypothetical protein NZ529_04365 [Cytophagaceae bacterium]|nr:hypothetical protein [Cytophagaceae bacterium]MDW8456008.1 hypothetical protein [Cytophagaceae bacterium]
MKEAMVYLHKAIAPYNRERPHMSTGNLTPDQIHFAEKSVEVKRIWKNYKQKKTNSVNVSQD